MPKWGHWFWITTFIVGFAGKSHFSQKCKALSYHTLSQFHQHFTRKFYVRKSFQQLFLLTCNQRKAAKKASVQKICSYNVDETGGGVMIKLRLYCPSQSFHNSFYFDHLSSHEQMSIQSNLCTATTLLAPKQWPLWTGGRCSQVI